MEEQNRTENVAKEKILASKSEDVQVGGIQTTLTPEEVMAQKVPVPASQLADEANNNLESTSPKVNEGAGEPEPFDPMSVVANILKKKDGA